MTDERPTIASLMTFPCDHVFKAFGPGNDDGAIFAASVHRAVCEVFPVPLDALRQRQSSHSGYLCVSVVVRVVDAEQVEAIYSALKRVEGLLFLL